VEASRWLGWKAVGDPNVSVDWSTSNPLSQGPKKRKERKERKKRKRKEKKIARVEQKINDNNWSCGRGTNVSG